MLPGLSFHPAVLAILCLVPAAFRWWSGRVLGPLVDDPILPERLAAHRRRNLHVLGIVLVVLFLFGPPGGLFWSLPLVMLSRVVAGYPFRCALFGERWSLLEYLSWSVRLSIAVYGFWLAAAAAPLVARLAGPFDWLAAGACAAGLALWHTRSAGVFRWLVRARPLAEGPLLERFRAIAASSLAPMPRFEVVAMGGGALANALALASPRGSSVVYTDTLLGLLDADEAAAITAHEIAHLEHFDAARLRRIGQVTLTVVAASAGAALLPRAFPWLSPLMLAPLWMSALVLTLAWMARDRQRNETASDLRALELCGSPDPLIGALTKVYAFSRMPRRLDAQAEQMASHPSLARRIRAIREAAGSIAAPALERPEIVSAANGAVTLTFESDRLQWQESAGVVHVISYAHLTELRVVAAAAGSATLVAVESGGRRWQAALDASEASRTQTILDRVDVRLAEPPVVRPTLPLLQIAGAAVAICAMWAGHLVVMTVALWASLRSAPAFSAAAGGAALAGAALAARQAIAAGNVSSVWPGLALAVLGAGLIAAAWRRRDDAVSRPVNLGVAVLAVLTAGSLGLIAVRGASAVSLYQASLAIPGGAILPVALAAALACMPRRAWRLAAGPLVLAGLFVAVAGSGTFLHAFGRDPLLVSARPIAMEALPASPAEDFTVPGQAADLRISPGGVRIAVTRHSGAVGVVTGFSVGTPGSLAQVTGNDLLFVDDERILTATVDGADTIVREVNLRGAPAVVWEERLQDVQAARLAYRAAAERWIVTGATMEGRIVSVEGQPGRRDRGRREWTADDEPGWADAWAVQGDTVLAARRTLAFDPADGRALGITMLLMIDQTRTRLTRITPAGATDVATSQLETSCDDHALDAERLVCLAFDGARTQVVTIDPASVTPTPVGSLPGRFVSYRPTRGGWMSGWTDVGGWLDTTQIAVDVVGGRAIAVSRESGIHELTVVGGTAGTLTSVGGAATRVRLYRLPEP